MNFFLLLLTLPIDFHSMEKKKVNGTNQLVINILQYIFVCVQQKKENQTSKCQNFYFWVNYPFNDLKREVNDIDMNCIDILLALSFNSVSFL